MLNIKSHFKNKTVISIAHRMQTLRNANRIWVVDGGQIAEEGSHEDLIKIEGGIYQNFMRTYVDY